MELKTFRIGGVHPEENKLTSDKVTQIAALPKQAIFPLSQHIGAPAKPVVQKGDKVKVGTMIAEAGGFVSAPIYSSVSRLTKQSMLLAIVSHQLSLMSKETNGKRALIVQTS